MSKTSERDVIHDKRSLVPRCYRDWQTWSRSRPLAVPENCQVLQRGCALGGDEEHHFKLIVGHRRVAQRDQSSAVDCGVVGENNARMKGYGDGTLAAVEANSPSAERGGHGHRPPQRAR